MERVAVLDVGVPSTPEDLIELGARNRARQVFSARRVPLRELDHEALRHPNRREWSALAFKGEPEYPNMELRARVPVAHSEDQVAWFRRRGLDSSRISGRWMWSARAPGHDGMPGGPGRGILGTSTHTFQQAVGRSFVLYGSLGLRTAASVKDCGELSGAAMETAWYVGVGSGATITRESDTSYGAVSEQASIALLGGGLVGTTVVGRNRAAC